MKTLYIAMTFLLTLGIILGIYTASYNQFNLNGASTTYSTFTSFQITTTNSQFINSANISPINSTNTLQSCDIFCTIWTGIVNAGTAVCNFIGAQDCIVFGGATPTAQLLSLGQNSSGEIKNINIANQFANGQTSASNIWLGDILGNPLDEALLIMGIFLGIGLLAGLFGAGILAVRIASVGIGLSVITFIEGSLGVFGTLPLLVSIGFNGVIGALLLIVAWESFNAPGGGAG